MDSVKNRPPVSWRLRWWPSWNFIQAKTTFLQRFNCVLPHLSQDNRLELTEARHPLLEEHLRSTNQVVVPVSLRLDDDDTALVISGANAGGKTVVLKTAGLLSLMALSGLPVSRPLRPYSPLHHGPGRHWRPPVNRRQSLHLHLSRGQREPHDGSVPFPGAGTAGRGGDRH